MMRHTDKEMYDWLESNEHSISGNSYDGYEIVTVYGTYEGDTIRNILDYVLECETMYNAAKQMPLEGI